MSSPHKVVIVEDEKHSLGALKNLLGEFFPSVIVVGAASSVVDAVKVINQNNPAIVFLDIELNPGTGFDVVSQTRNMRLYSPLHMNNMPFRLSGSVLSTTCSSLLIWKNFHQRLKKQSDT